MMAGVSAFAAAMARSKANMGSRTAFLAAIITFCGVAALPITRGSAATYFIQNGPPKSSAAAALPPVPPDFSLPDAMKAVYGNYDPAKKTSTFRLAKKFPNTFFDKPGKVAAKEFLAAGAADSGGTKVFLLTYAVPAAAPEFSCHACAPVIGAAIFAKKNGAWTLETAEKSLDVLGNFGGPPRASVVRVGPDRAAFELHPGNTNQGETVADTMILLPWKGEIRVALDVETESTVTSDCGDGNECADKQSEISFARGANPDYDDLVLTISGTATNAKSGQGVPVRRVQTWKFADGKFVRAEK